MTDITSLSLVKPTSILFDWHGTLVNTLDAMYQAIEDMLPQLEELDLVRCLVPEEQAKTPEDAKLVRYIRIFRHLHPKILAEQRVSRTDIFDALFGSNCTAQEIAHNAYNECYRHHYGDVCPFEEGVVDYLKALKVLGIKIAVATNRSREFLDNELRQVEDGKWRDLLSISVCGDEVERYKPAPDVLFTAMSKLGVKPGPEVWYVGDSVTDMITARQAGVTAIFYNGALWDAAWIESMFPPIEQLSPEGHRMQGPDAVVDDFDHLFDLIKQAGGDEDSSFIDTLDTLRPPRRPPRVPPPPRIEPDWHPSVANLEPPEIILFDWHATLVDTLDAMYHAVDDMLPELSELGLDTRLVEPAQCKSPEDAKLVEYVRDFRKLHPKIKTDRKISRTDIFEVLFGDDEDAKKNAHHAFTKHYRNHYGTVLPFEPQVKEVLQGLRQLPLKVGVITNRDREFFLHELAAVEGTGWSELFDVSVCGDDTPIRKPHPQQIFKAVSDLSADASKKVWYVGDSTTDTMAANTANITSVFFNGAQWDQPWLNKIFPGNERYPHKPDVVVNDFSEFWALVLACRGKTN